MVVVLCMTNSIFMCPRMFVLVGIEFCDESFYPQSFG